MANVMNMRRVKNSVSRDGFDLSKKVNFTAKAGELLPVWCKEVIPGDKVTIDLSSFTRTMPVNTAAFARIREYYDFFFVPFSHLWNRANTVLSQMNYDQKHAVSLFPTDSSVSMVYSGTMPYLTASQIGSYIRLMSNMSDDTLKNNLFGFDRSRCSCKLLQYLGYGDYSGFVGSSDGDVNYNVQLNAFGLLAYQKIYADFYRDQQWEYPAPETFNVDYMNGTGVTSTMNLNVPRETNNAFFENYNLFDLRYVNWNKDLYHGILPNAQYGDTAVVPLGGISGSSTVSGYVKIPVVYNSGVSQPLFEILGSSNNTGYHLHANSNGDASFVSDKPNAQVGTNGTVVWGADVGLSAEGNVSFDTGGSSSSAGLSILALRQYQFLQKWKEIVQSTQQNYKDQVKAIWNVDVSDHLSETVTYLGGVNGNLSINEVVNTNLASADSQAEIYGKGVGSCNGKITFDSRGEFGYIMCIYHCQPVVDYTTSYIDPQYMRVNAEDFANPVFDKVGMQQITDASLLTQYSTAYDGTSTPRVLGFVPRYADYKTDIDLSLGAFRDTLNHWVVSYDAADIRLGLTGGMVSDVGPDGQPNPNGNPNEPSDISSSYGFLKMNPHIMDPIFTVAADSTVETDQFLCSTFFDVKMVRNLDADGLPY